MEGFVKILKKLFPYTLILTVVYFAVPAFILFQQEEELVQRLLVGDMMLIKPAVSFFTALWFGVKQGRQWYFVLLVAILFLLCMLLLYGFSYFSYLILYCAAAALGLYLGSKAKEGMDQGYL